MQDTETKAMKHLGAENINGDDRKCRRQIAANEPDSRTLLTGTRFSENYGLIIERTKPDTSCRVKTMKEEKEEEERHRAIEPSAKERLHEAKIWRQ